MTGADDGTNRRGGGAGPTPRTALAGIRHAAMLVHTFPDRVAVLESGFRSLRVSSRAEGGVAMTPCALRRALGAALRRDDVGALARMLGLPPGPLRARLLPRAGDPGLGIYRFERGSEWGYAFGSLLDPVAVDATVRRAIGELRSHGTPEREALEHGAVSVVHDPGLEASVLLVAYDDELDAHEEAEDVAVAIAAACAAEEVATLAGSRLRDVKQPE